MNQENENIAYMTNGNENTDMKFRIPNKGEVICYHSNGAATIVSEKVFVRVVFMQQESDRLDVQPRYVSYSVGAKMYSMSEKFFREWVNEINAVHRVKGRVIVDLEKIEEHLKYC